MALDIFGRWRCIYTSFICKVAFIQNYIQAWLFGPVQEEKSPHDKLMETSSVILTALESFKNTILGLESSIEKYSAKLDQVTDQMKQVSNNLATTFKLYQ